MAKGVLTGKTRTQQADLISNPVLNYTDAMPRNDLRAVEDASKSKNERRVSPSAVAHWDFQRPRTSDRPTKYRKPHNPNSDFDFRITVPPVDAVPSPMSTGKGLNSDMIGIALGSPRLVKSQNIPPQVQDDHIHAVTIPAAAKPKKTPVQRKSSKWRKIGGLFRAKNALASTENRPFYQVRVENHNWPLQNPSYSMDSIDYQSHPKAEVHSNDPSRNGNQPNVNGSKESWPSLVPEPNVSTHGKRQGSGTGGQASKPNPNNSGMLQVDIPNVELERYSVMFDGLLGKRQQPSLARRSKTLDDITFLKTEPPRSSPDFHRPQPLRRATSPTRSKSPSFTLFPATETSKASKVLGSQNLPRGPSPFMRSHTSLTGLLKEHPSTEQNRVSAKWHSPSIKSRTSHKPQDSAASFISYTSIDSERDARLLSRRLQHTDSYIDTHDLSDCETIKEKPFETDLQQTGPPSLRLNTKELPPQPANNVSASSSPPSMLSPLNPTRQRVDRIMSPVSSAVSPAESTRMPLSDKDEEEETKDEDEDEDENEATTDEPADQLPRIEVSIARSISVAKGRKQILVPVRPRADRLNTDERLVDNRAKTPQVMDGKYGHRHGHSQDVRIETI